MRRGLLRLLSWLRWFHIGEWSDGIVAGTVDEVAAFLCPCPLGFNEVMALAADTHPCDDEKEAGRPAFAMVDLLGWLHTLAFIVRPALASWMGLEIGDPELQVSRTVSLALVRSRVEPFPFDGI